MCNISSEADDRDDVHWDAVLITAVAGAVAVVLGMFANWVARPKWADKHPRWVVAGLVVLVAASVAITLLVAPSGNDQAGGDPATAPSAPAPTSILADPSATQPPSGGGANSLSGGAGGGSAPPPGGSGGRPVQPADPPVVALRIASSAKLPTIRVGEAWSSTFRATGGTSPYRWTIVSGQVPPRFVLQPEGELGGTVLTTDSAAFTLQVADSLGQTATGRFTLTPVPRRSDLNQDGPVGCQDKQILLNHFNQPGTPETGDVNHDGTVNITDLSMLLSDWTGDSTTCD